MNEEKTKSLDNILKSAKMTDFDKYVNDKIPDNVPSLSSYLEDYLASHSLDRNTVVKSSGISKDYAYSIINGNRTNPARDRLIALCLAMHMPIDDFQHTLKLAGLGELYSKNQRDAAVIISVNNQKWDVNELNEFLYDHGLKTLTMSKDD